MGTYVVGDVHGCYSLWMKLKEQIESKDKDAKFIFVGDIIDRGPEVYKMLTWCMNNIKPGGKYQMVIGNHEYMKLEWAKQYENYTLDDPENTKTYSKFENDNYSFGARLSAQEVSDSEALSIIEFFKSLPFYIDLDINVNGHDTYFVVCHSSLPYEALNKDGRVQIDSYEKLTDRINIRNDILWYRNYWGNSWEYKTIVVHGHTATNDIDLMVRFSEPGKIDFRRNDINVDCGAVFKDSTSNLGAICLDTLEEFYVYDKEVDEYSLGRSQDNKAEMLYFIEHGEYAMFIDEE